MNSNQNIIIKSINELTKDEQMIWENLISDDTFGAVHSTYAWLNTINITEKEAEMNLILCYSELGVLEGGLPFCITKEDIRMYYNIGTLIAGPNLYSSVQIVDEKPSKNELFPSILVTSLSGTGCDYRYTADLPKEDICNNLKVMIKYLRNLKHIKSICFNCVPEDAYYINNVLKELGYIKSFQGLRH